MRIRCWTLLLEIQAALAWELCDCDVWWICFGLGVYVLLALYSAESVMRLVRESKGSLRPRAGVGNWFGSGAAFIRLRSAEGHNVWKLKQTSVQVSLSTNVCCVELEDILDSKIFVNASAGHWKRYGGPHLARGPLFAHPWPGGQSMPAGWLCIVGLHLPRNIILPVRGGNVFVVVL